MGIYYQFYAEAKINGQWRGIDLYARAYDGGMEPVPLFEGKSCARSMMEWLGEEYTITKEGLSPELKADHKWLFEDDGLPSVQKNHFIYGIGGAAIKARDTKLPEFAGFVSKDNILSYKKGETEEILDCLTPDEFKELPEDVRKGYDWFEWTEPYGDQENFAHMKSELARRVNAFNSVRFGWPCQSIPREISMDDCRVVVILS